MRDARDPISLLGKLLRVVLLFVPTSCSFAALYCLDSVSGDDLNDGRTGSTAWRTMARANLQTFAPGDSLLLKRGCAWHGPGFKAQGSGSASAPITLADYGDAALPRPLIDGVGPHEPAILLQNVQNWTVANLELTQHGQTPQALDANNEKGKDADQYSDEYMRAIVHVLGLGPAGEPVSEACTVRNIVLQNLFVHGGSWNGIYASGGYYQLKSARYGCIDTLVVSKVECSNNHKAGVEVTCTYFQERVYTASNIWVLDSNLHHNGGDGAMVGPVKNALLEGNVCSYNGQIRNARVGVWTWDSENTTIQFNESHHNVTPLTDGKARDGAGFDLDLGTEDGCIQYNWSHDNQGEGYLFVSWPVGYGYSRGESHNALMRYNISERDGKKLAGAITVFGGVAPLIVHNNTVYYEPDRGAGTVMFNGEGGALTTSIWGKSGKPDLRVYNNIFIVNGRTNSAAVSNLLWTDGAGTFTFDNNVWWRAEGGVRMQWAGTVITSWSEWQGSGFDPAGLNVNPLMNGALGSGPAAYSLRAGSPAIDLGRSVTDGWRDMGLQDASGATIPQGSQFEAGAFEFATLHPDPAAARIISLFPRFQGSWRVEFEGRPGRSYWVEASPDLRHWTRIGLGSEQAPGNFVFTESSTAPARFYRAVARAVPGF